MKFFGKLLFIAMASSLLVVSCARMEKLGPRYDAKQCPFCTQAKGVCATCHGTTACSFCKGTGKRTTISAELSDKQMPTATYTEVCPYCKGSAKCTLCDATGKCWPCHGTGAIESWDFYAAHQHKKSN